MKKSLVLAGLLSVSSIAMADVYVGVDYGINSNTDTATGRVNGSQENSYSDLSIKVGYGIDGDWKTQLRLSKISYDKTIFDDSHKNLTELGVDAIKEFSIHSYKGLYPYLKVGLAYGSMDVDGYDDSSIGEVSFNVGAGVSYKVVNHLYVVGGVDYVGRRWSDTVYSDGSSTSVTGSGFKPYMGINYSF